SIPDDDTIQGGDDWDILLGDSGNIPARTVIDPNPPYNNLSGIVYAGGPGRDNIKGGAGLDFINGQLGDDVLAGDAGKHTVIAGLGNDVIYVSLDDDTIDGGWGFDTVISTRDVPVVQLTGVGGNGTLVHLTQLLVPLSTFTLTSVEMAQIFGG